MPSLDAFGGSAPKPRLNSCSSSPYMHALSISAAIGWIIKHFSAEHIKARAVRRLNAEEQFVCIRPTAGFCHKTFLSRAVCAELIGSSLSSWSTTCMSYEVKKRRTETNRPHYTAHPRRLGASTPTAHPMRLQYATSLRNVVKLTGRVLRESI